MAGAAFSSAVSLFMMKYYTYIFLPADFGILSLYLIMFKYVSAFASLNLDSGSVRFYFDYKYNRRDEYLSTIFWLITFTSMVVLILGIFFKDPISNWISLNSQDIYLITLFTGVVAVYASFLTRVLYNENKSSLVLKHTIFQTFINHTSSVIFVSVFHLNVFGRIAGQGLGYLLNTITLINDLSKKKLFNIKLVFNKGMAKETFMLTLPSMISMFLGVAFIYVDRFFLKHYMGDTAVGIYTLGYLLGQGLSVVYEAISQAVLPKVYSDMNNNYEEAKNELERFSYKYYIGLVIITVIISLLSPIMVAIFSNDNYAQSAVVMPFIMTGFMMGGFYKIPSLILGFHKVVWFYPMLSIFSFGINALLNWWLIPIYGMVGSAFASFLSIFLYSLYLQYRASSYFSVKNNIFTFFLYVFVFIIILGVFYG
ncbi:oligosaccharide flippase family protein [Campylobacter mucosalis]|uniref:oligosaccharide flippase family protein n=1 Tax=Campylobacter mucosalis TaxID=202 RepID=UPI00147011E3